MAKEVDTGRRFESTFTGKCFIGFVIAFEVSYNILLHIGPTAELSSWPWLRAKVRDSTDYRLLHCAFVREWFKFNPAMGAHHCWLECDEYRSSQIEGTGGRAPRFDPCVRYCSIRHCTFIHCEPKKTPKCILSYLLQNDANSGKVWNIFCRFNLP